MTTQSIPAATDPRLAESLSAGTHEPDYVLTGEVETDPARIFSNVSAEDQAFRDRARTFAKEEILPIISDYWDRADYPLHLIKRLGDLDLLRDGIDADGFEPMSRMAAGLVTMELSRGDGSIGTVVGVQGGLALRSILLRLPRTEAALAAGTGPWRGVRRVRADRTDARFRFGGTGNHRDACPGRLRPQR